MCSLKKKKEEAGKEGWKGERRGYYCWVVREGSGPCRHVGEEFSRQREWLTTSFCWKLVKGQMSRTF